MAFRVIQARRLYQEIALQVWANIEKGALPVGARLPSERELAEQLKVSRPSVREALIALEVEGVVEVRPGAGVFVRAPVRPFPSYASSEGPLEIMRARIAIEGETAAMAAKQIRDADIRELGRILETMDPHLHSQDFYLQADRAFHLYIAAKAGNSVLIRIVAELFDARHSPLSLQLESTSKTRSRGVKRLPSTRRSLRPCPLGIPVLLKKRCNGISAAPITA
jgi:GntR family transcriptional repressor for pyruvate dehydrogenase complex